MTIAPGVVQHTASAVIGGAQCQCPGGVVFSLSHSSVAGVLGAFGLISGGGGCNLVARHLVGQITTEPFEGALRNQSQVEVNYMTQIISKHCITQKSPYRMEISDCFGGGSAVYHSDCSVFEPVFSCLHISLSKIGEGNLNRPWKQMRRTQGAPAASLQCVESRIEHRAFAVRCFLERSLRLHLMCHTLLGSAVLGKYE